MDRDTGRGKRPSLPFTQLTSYSEVANRRDEGPTTNVIPPNRSKKGVLGKNNDIIIKESDGESCDDPRRRLEEANQLLQGKVDELKATKRNLTKDLGSARREVTALRNELNKLRHEAQQAQGRFAALLADYQQSENRHISHRQLLEQRTQELQSARSYLNPARLHSGAELIRLAEALNTEILNVAASITDAVDIDVKTEDDKDMLLDAGSSHGYSEVKSILGERVTRLLEDLRSKCSYHTFRAILQSALQGVVVDHLVHMVNAYGVPHSSQSAHLEAVHIGIRNNGESENPCSRFQAT